MKFGITYHVIVYWEFQSPKFTPVKPISFIIINIYIYIIIIIIIISSFIGLKLFQSEKRAVNFFSIYRFIVCIYVR